MPAKTGGSPLPSPVTTSGGLFGRCWVTHPGRAVPSWTIPRADAVRTITSTTNWRSGPAGAPPRSAAQILLDAGIPSSVVVPPRDIAANPQLRYRGLFEMEEHPVTGRHEIPMLPFRFSRVAHWLRSPAPTLGRDNEAVLGELGYSSAEVTSLLQSGLIGDLPEGL